MFKKVTKALCPVALTVVLMISVTAYAGEFILIESDFWGVEMTLDSEPIKHESSEWHKAITINAGTTLTVTSPEEGFGNFVNMILAVQDSETLNSDEFWEQDGILKFGGGYLNSQHTWEVGGPLVTYKFDTPGNFRLRGMFELSDGVADLADVTVTVIGDYITQPQNPVPEQVSSKISVLINGQCQSFDTAPQLINNRTMLPLREIGEALGMEVGYDSSIHTVTMTNDNLLLIHKIGNTSITVDDVVKEFDFASVVVDGRTLMPLTMLSEAIGADIEWEETTRTVIINIDYDGEDHSRHGMETIEILRPPNMDTKPERHYPEQRYIEWNFSTYEEPNPKAEIIETFSPQIITVLEKTETGWGLIKTYKGDFWIYLNEPEPYILQEYMTLPFFIDDNADLYVEFWYERPDLDIETIIWKVNASVHVPFYSQIKVNYHPNPLFITPAYRLPDGFTPAELVPVNHENYSLLATPETVEAFRSLREAARNNGFDISVTSAYRSAARQSQLWINGGRRDGAIARPYHSEHQTGRALDLWGPGGLLDASVPSPTGRWVAENAHHHGFILRYQAETTHITGYIYEPWHITFVGTEISNYMYQNNILTLEEFVGRNPGAISPY